MFYLLKAFGVSIFVEAEWERYWIEGDGNRLYKAQIINEQHVIEDPLLQKHYFHKKVFDNILFFFQECLKVSAVVFPNQNGELYGFSVTHFKDVNRRIELGKNLHHLLFYSSAAHSIKHFALTVPHTGSRQDYEQFIPKLHQGSRQLRELRELTTRVNHKRRYYSDWFHGIIKGQWFAEPRQMGSHMETYHLKRGMLNKIALTWLKS